MIRLLIVDDQTVVREGLKVILSATTTMEVVGMAANGEEALHLVRTLMPDLVLMDLKMPVMNGIRSTQLIREEFPAVAVLVLTTYDDDDWVLDAIRMGASGYLLKDSRSEDLIAAIEGTVAGKSHLDPGIARKVMDAARFGAPAHAGLLEHLTEREADILRLMASGMSNAAIADRLILAEGTVRNHVTTIFSKLNVTDRAQATALAWRHGLVKP